MQGNAEFKTEGDRVRPAQQSSLATVAQLLNVDQTELGRALCHRVIAANGELMEKGHTASEAVYGRDAFAKVTVSFPFLSLSLSLSLRPLPSTARAANGTRRLHYNHVVIDDRVLSLFSFSRMRLVWLQHSFS